MRAATIGIAGISVFFVAGVVDSPAPSDYNPALPVSYLAGARPHPESTPDPEHISASDDQVPASANPGTLPQALLWGTVQTENGATVSGARISLYSDSLKSNHVALSRDNGEFLFQNLRPAQDFRISLNPRGMYKRYHRIIDIDSNETHSDIVLEALPTAFLAGRVIDVNGIPVPDFSLSLRSSVKQTWSRHVVTDLMGDFRIERFPIGVYEVSSMSGLLLNITGLRFEGETDPVELIVDAGPYTVSGRVYDHMGNPLGGAGVFLDWTLHRGEVRNFTARRTMTDPDGRFSIDGLGEGNHELLLVANGESVYRRVIDPGRESGHMDVVMDMPTYQ